MKIKSIHIKNFRGFKELNITFPSSNLALFIGINGAGKTAILDCIAAFLSQIACHIIKRENPDFSITVDDINVNSETGISNTITLETNKIPEEINLNLLSSASQSYPFNKFSTEIVFEADQAFDKYLHKIQEEATYKDHYCSLPVLAYYRTNRAFLTEIPSDDSSEQYVVSNFYTYQHAFSKNITEFSDFFAWFRFEEDKENELIKEHQNFDVTNRNLDIIRKAIQRFLQALSSDSFSNLRIEREEKQHFAFNAAHQSSLVINKNDQKLKIEQLSEGEKVVLLMICDIARRLAIATDLEDDALQGTGIVLIDEIDLHLHPQWQREIIPSLQYTFPHIQFIITTHSPHIVASVHKEQIQVLVKEEETVRIINSFTGSYGWRVDKVLLEIFRVKGLRTPSIEEKLVELRDMVFADRYSTDECRLLQRELEHTIGYDDMDLALIRMEIAKRKTKNEADN